MPPCHNRPFHRPEGKPAWTPSSFPCSSAPSPKGPLDYVRGQNELISRSARLAYPVRDGIPILLEGEARAVTEDEIAQLPARAPLV